MLSFEDIFKQNTEDIVEWKSVLVQTDQQAPFVERQMNKNPKGVLL